MHKAQFIKKLDGFTGDARLYHLDPPLAGYGDEETYEYVVVSATVAFDSGPETFIFGADKNGEVEDWLELSGSVQGTLVHAEALENAGYAIQT